MKLTRYNPRTVHLLFADDDICAEKFADYIESKTEHGITAIEIRHNRETRQNTIIFRCTYQQQAALENLLSLMCTLGVVGGENETI